MSSQEDSSLIKDKPSPTDKELDALWDEEACYYALYDRARRFGRAVLEKWAND